MDTRDDKTLIESILAGDQGDFALLLARYQKLVVHLVARMIPRASDREDLCQEIFLRIYRSLGEFEHKSKLSTWVATVAHNTCINYLQKKRLPLYEDLAGPESDENAEASRRLEWVPAAEASPLEHVEARDLRATLQREIDALPLTFRAILTLFHLEEMSYSEIAEVTALPEGTVKSYLFRARRLLRDRLAAQYPVEA
ncbi:MAG TPA: sigma-70 family RNA polymerase sigma factor [bacterium]|nr:sigma-70 family RNA polymerase sigma factor [bacterium]HQI47583.1 sigma-70 family RNA polymerase sigma factor [bacterium]HQJ64361.1 sigma-70 family RNA polymerase sigma factor [bacterium]HQJ65473.1 sigma-70 family RNA polymerase sigma factor [bacterium]